MTPVGALFGIRLNVRFCHGVSDQAEIDAVGAWKHQRTRLPAVLEPGLLRALVLAEAAAQDPSASELLYYARLILATRFETQNAVLLWGRVWGPEQSVSRLLASWFPWCSDQLARRGSAQPGLKLGPQEKWLQTVWCAGPRLWQGAWWRLVLMLAGDHVLTGWAPVEPACWRCGSLRQVRGQVIWLPLPPRFKIAAALPGSRGLVPTVLLRNAKSADDHCAASDLLVALGWWCDAAAWLKYWALAGAPAWRQLRIRGGCRAVQVSTACRILTRCNGQDLRMSWEAATGPGSYYNKSLKLRASTHFLQRS